MDLPPPLDEYEKLDWLRLIRTENVGTVTFWQLLRRFGSAAAALEALPDLARRGGRRKPPAIATHAAAERELAANAAAGARLVARGEPDYPPLLAAIEGAPPLLSVKGDARLAQQPCFAIVGARNASALGQRFAREIAAELGRSEITIVSGLARGIDAAAHEGALPAGTIAVLGTGIDVIYPRENERLYHAIAERGLIVAEMPVGTQVKAPNFPRRNRLISGMSLGVLVVEAAERSGSLITARLAGEQGRDVFAVPGSPFDPRARGPNQLLREGAALVETADDILRVLAPRRRPATAAPPAPSPEPVDSETDLEPARQAIVGLLGPTPVAVDELLRQSGLASPLLQTALLELELAGRLRRHPGGMVSAA